MFRHSVAFRLARIPVAGVALAAVCTTGCLTELEQAASIPRQNEIGSPTHEIRAEGEATAANNLVRRGATDWEEQPSERYEVRRFPVPVDVPVGAPVDAIVHESAEQNEALAIQRQADRDLKAAEDRARSFEAQAVRERTRRIDLAADQVRLKQEEIRELEERLKREEAELKFAQTDFDSAKRGDNARQIKDTEEALRKEQADVDELMKRMHELKQQLLDAQQTLDDARRPLPSGAF